MQMLMNGFLWTEVLFASSINFPSNPMRKFAKGSFAFRADRLIQTDDDCKRGRGRFEYLAVICAPPLQSRAAKPEQPRSLDIFS
jgi:hypothetical protein